MEAMSHELAPLGPSFVSVTYGALGSTREITREIVERINAEQEFPALVVAWHLPLVRTCGDDIALPHFVLAGGIQNRIALDRLFRRSERTCWLSSVRGC